MNSTQNTSDKIALDASAWIELLKGTPKGEKIAKHIEAKTICSSTYTVYEVCAVLGRQGKSVEDVFRVLLSKTLVIYLSSEIAGNAAQFYIVTRQKRPKISGGDAITLATVDDYGIPLITCDNDFRGMKNVIVV